MIYRRRIFTQISPQSVDQFLRVFNHVRSINKIHKSCVSSHTIVLNHLAVPLIELNSKQRVDLKDKYEREKKIARLHWRYHENHALFTYRRVTHYMHASGMEIRVKMFPRSKHLILSVWTTVLFICDWSWARKIFFTIVVIKTLTIGLWANEQP